MEDVYLIELYLFCLCFGWVREQTGAIMYNKSNFNESTTGADLLSQIDLYKIISVRINTFISIKTVDNVIDLDIQHIPF